MPSRRVVWFGLALCLLLFAGQGVRLAHRMVSWGDESAYLVLGALVARGDIDLFQDDLRGQRMPLPFYVLGASQLVFGRSLLAARLVSLALGLGALGLVATIAWRLGGPAAALLAAAFLAGEGIMAGFFATAMYHSLAAVIILGGLALGLWVPTPAGRVAAMAVVSLLFLVRGSLWPLLPAALLLLLVLARHTIERACLLVAAVVVPAGFFLSDARHLKILAYVPGLRRLVAPLGYESVQPLIGHEAHGVREQLAGVLRLGRMYEYWWLAAAALVVVLVARRVRGHAPPPVVGSAATGLVAGTLAFTFLVQLPVYGDRFREVASLFPSFAALVPVLLGTGYAAALAQRDGSRAWRAGLVVILGVSLVMPAVVVRHPLIPASPAARPLADMNEAAAHLARVIPDGARVFLYGYALPVYLAGRTPYLQQIHDPNSLAAVEDRRAIERNGLWGLGEIDRWLGQDADVALVIPSVIDAFRRTRPAVIARIEGMLERHFVLVDRVTEYPWWTYDVYRRRSRAGERAPLPATPLR